jgi:hypothetical protein
MSSRSNPCNGYVIEATTLATVLPEDKRAEYLTMVSDDETDSDMWEKAIEFLTEHRQSPVAVPISMFLLSGEDEADDLEEGVVYAYFDETSLFIKTPTQALINLEGYGVHPADTSWTMWG